MGCLVSGVGGLHSHILGTIILTIFIHYYAASHYRNSKIGRDAGQANYSASKAGVIGLTKSVARELSSRGITCNAVAPGFIDTEMTAQMTDKAKEAVKTQIPLGRVGKVDDIAEVVTFLASEKASYITGQVISVDGGMSI